MRPNVGSLRVLVRGQRGVQTRPSERPANLPLTSRRPNLNLALLQQPLILRLGSQIVNPSPRQVLHHWPGGMREAIEFMSQIVSW